MGHEAGVYRKRILGGVRLMSAMATAASMSTALLASLGVANGSAPAYFDRLLAVVSSPPVSIIAAMIVGQWIGEALDARWIASKEAGEVLRGAISSTVSALHG